MMAYARAIRAEEISLYAAIVTELSKYLVMTAERNRKRERSVKINKLKFEYKTFLGFPTLISTQIELTRE